MTYNTLNFKRAVFDWWYFETILFRLQTERDATRVGSGKLRTLVTGAGVVGAMECQPRCHMDTLTLTPMDTMDTTMAGMDSMHTTHRIMQSVAQLTKDSSASDEDLPEPKT